MGLLDNLIGAVGANLGGATANPQAALIGQLGQLLAGSGGTGNLGGLVQAFEQGGLGHLMQSWVGGGANLPIDAGQLQNVLGSDRIAAMASAVGLSHGDTLAHLSALLPQVIDHLTPQGQMPEGGHVDLGSLSAFAGQLLGGTR